MVSKLMIWLVSRFLASRRRRRNPVDFQPTPETRSTPREKKPPLGLRLCGDLERLERWGSVAPKTLVLMFRPDQPVELLPVGRRLSPALLPWRQPVELLVVNTAPTHLDVTVCRLRSSDGVEVDDVVVRVEVQVSADDSYHALIDLVADHGPAIEAHLLERVQHEVTSQIQALVSGVSFVELHGDKFCQLLTARWKPRGFASRSLVRLSFTTGELTGAEQADPVAPPTDTDPRPVERPRARLETTPRMELTVDATLRRLWLRHCQTPLAGIATARAGDAATVVAVPTVPPTAWDRTQVEEAFTAHFAGISLHVVLLDGSSYQGLVQSWFRQVEHGELRLVSVQSLDGDTVLRVVIDDDSGDYHSARVGTAADRDALQGLVPHTSITIDQPDRVAARGSG